MAQFILDSWYVAAWAAEVEHTILARTLLGQPVILFRRSDDTVAALQGLCPHRFAPLERGQLVGDEVECGYHGLRFDGAGRCTLNPHAGRTPDQARLRVYPVAERHGLIWIWPGAPEAADPAAIPDFGHLTAPGHRTVSGSNLTQAHYELLTDNLLDLSHAAFVHASFFQTSMMLGAEVTLTQDGDRLVQRYECPPADALALRGAAEAGLSGRVSESFHVHWQAPGFVRLEAGARTEARPEERVIFNIGTHILTPETERSTHYFYAGTRSYALDDAALDEGLRHWHRVGFGEQDKPMIEAVQRAMGGTDLLALQPVLLSVDTAAIRARRIVRGLLETASRAAA